MVGRFESAELKRDALAHEDLQSRQGVLSTCACLLGVILTVLGLVGMASPLGSLEALPMLHLGSPALPGPSAGARTPEPELEDVRWVPVEPWSSRSEAWRSESDVWSSWMEPKEPEISHLHVDFSLITLMTTLLAVCVLPPLLRSSPPSLSNDNILNRPPQTAQGGQQFPLRDLLGGGAPGRLIDVKPGEMQGSQSGGLFGSYGSYGPNTWVQAGNPWSSWGANHPNNSAWASGPGTANPSHMSPMDWTATPPTTWQTGTGWPGPVGIQTGPPGPVASQAPGGSWSTAVPSPYFGARSTVGPPLGLASSSSGPSESEVQETYATFGEQLQQWAPGIAAAIDQEVIGQVLQQLEQSDQMWQQALGPRGWRLSTELPQTGRRVYGLGGTTQEISVFERNLPKPFCDDPQANQQWQRRQQLEKFLVHPLFGPTARQYVLERLRDWRQRGILNATRHDNWRLNPNMPTDAHILENLVFQMLDLSLEFCDCFLAAGQAPPMVKHLGQAPVAFLRETTDQTQNPKPAPHYEVVVLQKVWRLRPSNRNLLEALALLMHALRKNSRSYNSFPQSLRNVLEGGANPWLPSIQSLYNRFF